MSTSVAEPARAMDVAFDAHMLIVSLDDGREIRIPLEWYPALRDASAEARGNWRLIGCGMGIHWPELDEDLSVRGMLMPSVQRKSA